MLLFPKKCKLLTKDWGSTHPHCLYTQRAASSDGGLMDQSTFMTTIKVPFSDRGGLPSIAGTYVARLWWCPFYIKQRRKKKSLSTGNKIRRLSGEKEMKSIYDTLTENLEKKELFSHSLSLIAQLRRLDEHWLQAHSIQITFLSTSVTRSVFSKPAHTHFLSTARTHARTEESRLT